MSGIGNQAGSFQAPHIPKRSARQEKGHATKATAASIKTVTKTPIPQKASPQEALPEKQLDQAQQKHSENLQDKRSTLAKARNQGADSFQKSSRSPVNPNKANLTQLADKIKKDQSLRERATEFAQKINAKQASSPKSRALSVDKPEAQQNQHIAAQAIQSHDDLNTNKKSRKKKDPIEALVADIVQRGGDKGVKFAKFIQREQSKGPLEDSIVQLIHDYHATLKGDSKTAAQLVESGDENLNLMRSMIAAGDDLEASSLKNALSTAIANSPGERSDLLALRNLEKTESKQVPPSPMQEAKRLPAELAVEFVNSINFGVIKAPWDPPLMLA